MPKLVEADVAARPPLPRPRRKWWKRREFPSDQRWYSSPLWRRCRFSRGFALHRRSKVNFPGGTEVTESKRTRHSTQSAASEKDEDCASDDSETGTHRWSGEDCAAAA